MTDDELLEQIKKQGLLDATTANRLKRDTLISGDSLEAAIAKERLLDDAKIAEIKSAIVKVPYKKIDPQDIDEKLFSIIPEETVRTYATIPLSLENNALIVGMLHPEDPKAQDAAKFIARQNHYGLGVYLISYGDWQDVLKRYSPYRGEIARAVQSLNINEGGKLGTVDPLSASSAEDAPVIKIVADTLREAVQSRASDIHIEPQEKELRIRFRVDGDLKQAASLPIELSQPVISRVKVISSLKIDEGRIPQDGRFRAKIFNKDIDFRVSTFPTPRGEKVAIRVLDPTIGLKSFENLQFLYGNLEIVKAGLARPYGMILITGPTGSGKTTTLYAFLQTLNNEKVNIVLWKIPSNISWRGSTSRRCGRRSDMISRRVSRNIAARSGYHHGRRDPRQRNRQSCRTGGADGAYRSLDFAHQQCRRRYPRLIDMKVEPFLLPVSLNLMVSQRLIGLLCYNCKKQEPAAQNIQDIIRKRSPGITGSDTQ